MKYDITLNFLPLNTSNFNFEIYRRKALSQEKSWNDKIKKYWLADEQFWTSFSDFEQAEKTVVNALKAPIGLVNRYLYFLLKGNFEKIDLKTSEKHSKVNRNRIYVSLETIKSANGKIIGEKSIWVEPYFLQTTNQFGFLLDYKFLQNKDYPFNREVQKHSLSLDASYGQNKNYHIDKNEIILSFIHGVIARAEILSQKLSITRQLQKIEADTLKPKTYIFKGNKTANSQFNGVMQHGPIEDASNEPFYFYIYKEEHKSFGQELVKALNGSFYTFKGMPKLNLPKQSKTNTKGIVINDFSLQEINRVLMEVKNSQQCNPIIISVTPEKEEDFYYQLKHQCLNENIPVQTVHTETIRNANSLKWAISSIAVQIFSKLGGVPWIVEPSHKNCLIVGIGQAHKYNRNEKKYERFFSYSVLIDSSGKFISIRQLADETNKEKFIKGITKSITEIILENDSYKKIIFHIPQKLNKDEIKTIENILAKSGKNIELSIIKINDKSDFIGFNLDKNSLVPYESSYVQISDKQYLIWTEGLNFHNSKAIKRYGNPLHIDFHYSNQLDNFENHMAYLQDILNLSGANYRGFNAKSLPVSSFYPKLIADFSKHFKELNLDLITKDTKKPWFL